MSDPLANPVYEYEKQRYESYVKARDSQIASSLEISGRYDKSILFLSGGALALSLTFIEKVAPHPYIWSFALLLAAWISLILAVMLELHALATSQNAIHEEIVRLDADWELPNPETPSARLEARLRFVY